MRLRLGRNGIPEKPGMREILAFFRERGVKIAVASSRRDDDSAQPSGRSISGLLNVRVVTEVYEREVRDEI